MTSTTFCPSYAGPMLAVSSLEMAQGYQYLEQGMNLLMCMLLYNAVDAVAGAHKSRFCPNKHV